MPQMFNINSNHRDTKNGYSANHNLRLIDTDIRASLESLT